MLLASAASLPAQARDGERHAAGAITIPSIRYTRYVLPNGLVALLEQDRSTPIVSVSIWYHVGSKNEQVGRTGLAHLFEHMMFEGSQNVDPGQHRIIIQSLGGTFNGSTTADRTNYYETVPSHHLETVLWMESDRMATLLGRVDSALLEKEREIVKNERRLRIDNQPFGLEAEVIQAALFPPGHPYSWSVIGSMADLSAATLDDVRSFFRTYYAPNNAVIAISGDIDVPATKELVARYFGGIPRGPAIIRPKVPSVTPSAEKRLVLEDGRVRLPQIRFAWPTVGADHADRYALRALSSVLTLDRTARLTKVLVYERQLATSVSSQNQENANGGVFVISASPRPGASLTEIERLVDSLLADLKTAPLSANDVQRFKNYTAVQTIKDLQYTFARAERLAEGETFHKDPLAFVKQLRKYDAVTAADVQRAARNYLTSGRVVLSMVPAGMLDLIARPEAPYANVTPATPAGS
jgi:zinc protease